MNKPKNILIARTDRIGDVVLTLPLCSIIKKYFPESKVSFLLRNYTSALAKNNSYIDEIIILKEKNGKALIFENIKLLKKKFDVCIIAYPTFRIALILFLSGIKIRIGTGYRWYSFLFNKKIFEHRKDAKYHELEYNVHLLRKIGIDEKVSPGNVQFGLTPSAESIEKVNELLELRNISTNKSILILHPGSGGSSVDFPIIKMKELAKKISDELDVEILITGSSNEKELCQTLVVSEKTKNFAGELNLSELIALIDKCKLLIANSTGPIHIAAALGKFVIGFYPDIVTCSEERWGPYTNKKVIFKPKISCINFQKEINCMDTIDVEDVYEAVKKILYGKQ
ncbi:MAG: glycosyltransferase family 9 protein [Melioribacter sp.]|uniref:glycosyltransferase family 9 protein n=1 Tax=Rosettibacter primus TaxID=3111523 RepID=UPI00247D3D80|nr:glycosyltransferase family 9 protein [Melioribacter sp.]